MASLHKNDWTVRAELTTLIQSSLVVIPLSSFHRLHIFSTALAFLLVKGLPAQEWVDMTNKALQWSVHYPPFIDCISFQLSWHFYRQKASLRKNELTWPTELTTLLQIFPMVIPLFTFHRLHIFSTVLGFYRQKASLRKNELIWPTELTTLLQSSPMVIPLFTFHRLHIFSTVLAFLLAKCLSAHSSFSTDVLPFLNQWCQLNNLEQLSVYNYAKTAHHANAEREREREREEGGIVSGWNW